MGRKIQRLQRLYDNPVKRDIFGRRKAMARELEQTIRPERTPFEDLIDQHLPTEKDLKDKNDN